MNKFTTFTKSFINKTKSYFVNNRLNDQINNNTSIDAIKARTQQDIIDNRYSYFKNDLFIAINLIANACASIPYVVYKNGEPVDNNDEVYKIIQRTLNNPSIRNQSVQQLIYEGVTEYLLNGVLFTNYGIREDGTIFIQHLKSYELQPYLAMNSQADMVTQNEGLKSYVIKSYKFVSLNGLSETRIFTLNDDGVYEYENTVDKYEQYILATDVEFEDSYNGRNMMNRHLSKSILHKIYDDVYVQDLISIRNQSSIINRKTGDLFILYGMTEHNEALRKVFTEALRNVVDNGRPQFITSNKPKESGSIEKVPVNEQQVNSEYHPEYLLRGKKIHSAFNVPLEYNLLEARFSNADIKSVEFIDKAVQPVLDKYFQHLTNVFALINEHDQNEYVIMAQYNATSIKQQYVLQNLSSYQGWITINEIRIKMGETPFTGPEGEQIFYIGNTLTS